MAILLPVLYHMKLVIKQTSFLSSYKNTRLPNPNEGEIICPTDRDSVKVEGVDVKTLGDSLVHLVSWKEMDEKYSQCLSYYVINRIQRRLKPEFSILSVVKFRVDGHLNNVIDDVDEDHDYVYKVKAFFKNCERTRFSERVLIRTSKAPAQNCNCTVSDSQNHTGILVPSLVLDVRHEIL
ncbi:unnamed protein product [Heterobilharzia americana]|nr:unnamed protein product [Heterobilharzia americana]